MANENDSIPMKNSALTAIAAKRVAQENGTKTIDPDASSQKREDNINYAVKQIFTKYPPVIK